MMRGGTYEFIGSELGEFYEAHGCRVHAVTQTSWLRTIVKDVAKMRIAISTGDRRAVHPETLIMYLYDVFRCDRLPEAWPSSAGFKLSVRAEDSRVATNAAVETAVMVIPGVTRIGSLRASVAGDLEWNRGEVLASFR